MNATVKGMVNSLQQEAYGYFFPTVIFCWESSSTRPTAWVQIYVRGAELDNAIGSNLVMLLLSIKKKVEEMGSSETSLIFYRTRRHYKPEEGKYTLR